jgi:hypothetical protein
MEAHSMTRNGLRALLAVCLLSACSGDKKDDGDELSDGGGRDASATDGAQIGAPNDGSAGPGPNTMDGSQNADAGDAGSGLIGEGRTPFFINDAGQVLCGNSVCQCSDGLDSDQDGLTDLQDPECVSSNDNDESSFATGISGDNRDDACQDCFFDGNSGSGDDGCRLPSSCLVTKGDATSGRGKNCSTCDSATDQCKNFCQQYTPNGCDCFGCCGVNLGSGIVKNVLLSAGCSISGSNTTGCTECVPSTACVNTCGRCELCPGKTLADLPADCASTSTRDGGTGTPSGDGGTGTPSGDAGTGVPVPSCDNGEASCGQGLPACATGSSCTFGCCIKVPILF